MMWKFVEEQDGKVVPNTNQGAGLICDAFVGVVQQPPPGRMTVLAVVEETKSRFGRQPRESVLRATRFTKEDAAAAGAFAAAQVAAIYEQVGSDDRLWAAIDAARSGKDDALRAAIDPVALAASEAREAGVDAAALAAEAARAAILAGMAREAGTALQATGYAVAYAIQSAGCINADWPVTMAIEKWLVSRAAELKKVRS
jgi:hypothetical protein